MTDKNTAITKTSQDTYRDLSDYLMSKNKMLAGIGPKYMDTERMVRIALSASSRSPKLLQCSQKSWLMALMDCAYYGLEPVLGQAYLIPYQNRKAAGQPLEVQFMVGYKGLISIACDNGFEDIDARLVYVGEIEAGRFEETPEDPQRPFKHRPLYQPESRGEVAGVYAIGWRGVDKRPRFKYLTVDEIESFRGRSKSAKEGPWMTDWDAMAMKTAVRRMLSMAQLKPGSKLGAVLEQENGTEAGEVIRAQDWKVDEAPRQSRLDALAATLAQKAGARHEQEPDENLDDPGSSPS